MGCGCGGRKNTSRSTALTPRAAGVRPQAPVQRQALIQQARERALGAMAPKGSNDVGARAELERRRRIQVSLRNRNAGG